MAITTLSLLPLTVHGTPSGNYDGSSLDFNGVPEKGVSYYRGQGNLETIIIQLTDFVGRIKIKASLNFDPVTAQWFDVYEYGDPFDPITEYHVANLTGNFAWLQVEVIDFTAGTINSITVSY